MGRRIRDWVSYWDSPHSVYVNARHADIHYRDIADAIIAFVPSREARVLDFGCGEALHADAVAAAVGRLTLCDAAPGVRKNVAARFAAIGNIEVLAPDAVRVVPDRSFDLIVANSVVQYLSRAELDDLLALWRRVLAPGGTLIIADVIPPQVGPLSDLVALLRYAHAHGFLLAAIVGVVRTAASSYRSLRAELGLAKYGEAEFLALLAAAGFAAERLPRNMEHNPARMTFRAVPA
jgi:SAM-dependent methyltransferase